jgi:hypothetical protein
MKMMERFEVETGPAWLRRGVSLLLAAYLGLTFYLVWRTAVLAPFSDEFTWVERWYQLKADHRWADYLLAPHNVSRPLWTRAALALDMGALGGGNTPLILSGVASLAVMATVLGREAVRAAPHPVKSVAGGLAVMLTLMAGNVLDASVPVYVTYTHAAVFAVLAIVLSEGSPGRGLGWRRAGAVACAVASAFGSGAGLALWPVMAWGALRRRDWSWLAAVLALGAAFIGLYLSGQGHAPDGAWAIGESKSAAILGLSFLALPWTRAAPHFAWIGGGLIALSAIAMILLKGGAKATPSERVACGLMLFTLGAAAMAALGRSGMEDPHDVPLRYGLLAAPMHAGVVMLAAPLLAGLWRDDRRLLAQCLSLALLTSVFAQDAAFAAKAIAASDTIRAAIADFHAGARTPLIRTLVHPDPAHAEAISDRLARDDLFQHDLHLKPRAPAR